MKLQAFDAVLFDLDGTLLDTAPDLAGAINDMRIARGLEAMPLHELAPMCSFGGRGMLSKGLDLRPDDADYRVSYDLFIETYRQRMTRDTQPFDGMREFVRRLADSGLAWGVVTNKIEALMAPLEEIRFRNGRQYNYSAVVEALHLGDFGDVEGGEGGPFNPRVPKEVAAEVEAAMGQLAQYH